MGDRAAKLRKLNAFRRRLPHCTASALGAILKEIKQHGVPEGATSRVAFKDARDLQNQSKTPFGAILQTLVVSDKDDVDQSHCFTLGSIFRVLKLQCVFLGEAEGQATIFRKSLAYSIIYR